MKKLVSVVLCLVMLFSVLSGCGREKTPKELFEEQKKQILALDDFSAEVTGNFTLNTAGLTSLLTGIESGEDEGSVSAEFSLNAAVSYTNKQAVAYGSVSVLSGEESLTITTDENTPLAFADDTTLYFNYSKFFEYLIGFCKIDGAEYSDFFEKDFIALDLSGEGNIWEKQKLSFNIETMSLYKSFAEKSPNLAAVLLKAINKLNALLNNGAYQAVGDEYTVTIDKTMMFRLLDYIVADMDTDKDTYTDAIIEYMWLQAEQEYASAGADEEYMESERESFVSTYSSTIRSMILPYLKSTYDEIDKDSFPEIAIKIGLKKAENGIHGISVSADIGEFVNCTVKSTVTETKAEKMTPPEDVIDTEVFAGLTTPNGVDAINRKMILKISISLSGII